MLLFYLTHCSYWANIREKYNSIFEGLELSPVNNQLPAGRRFETTKEGLVKIQFTLDLGVPVVKIAEQFGFSQWRIYYVWNHGLEPGKKRRGRKPALLDVKAQELGELATQKSTISTRTSSNDSKSRPWIRS